MCTLILYYRCRDDWPLLVAGNRDERLDRPAQAPRALPGKLRRWAGIDKEANGTWLGLNAAGTIVGLTNAARSMRGGLPKITDSGRSTARLASALSSTCR